MATLSPSLPSHNGNSTNVDHSSAQEYIPKENCLEFRPSTVEGSIYTTIEPHQDEQTASITPDPVGGTLNGLGHGNLRKSFKQEHEGDFTLPRPRCSKEDDVHGHDNSDTDSSKDDVGHGMVTIRSASQGREKKRSLKSSPSQIYQLASSPNSLPTQTSLDEIRNGSTSKVYKSRARGRWTVSEMPERSSPKEDRELEGAKDGTSYNAVVTPSISSTDEDPFPIRQDSIEAREHSARPHVTSRTPSTPLLKRRLSSSRSTGSSRPPLSISSIQPKLPPLPLKLSDPKVASRMAEIEGPQPSPMPASIPLPPLSFPTYLQLEMSSQRPSPLYIHRSVTSDFPYESSRVKLERLLSFLFLPPQLEQILWFGTLACLDAWLYSFTILPLRFLKALWVLGQAWAKNLAKEAQFLGAFIYAGTGRMWQRRGRRESINASAVSASIDDSGTADSPTDDNATTRAAENDHDNEGSRSNTSRKHRNKKPSKHRRTKSIPSALSPDHKADILKGFLIILTCMILMYFDASRMYHGIRGQAAIKLYVIYNVLEVCDRLFSAMGQDVLECLFSKETLERKPDGRSKVWQPFWMFVLAFFYNLVHSTALFYQVITLNVAVNSYSNALITLLISNQFVEIKSTVFKKFEKENLFQLTCADVVERFQLWLMLTIIASRNIIETGGLTLGSSGGGSAPTTSAGKFGILPASFDILPNWTGLVVGPFFIVLGSEMLVDWIKHAYITKFNNTKPAIYGRFLDVLAKDYYSNAFADQNLTRRLGLPVIPLACLFIRASVQTYHMFLASHMPSPLPSSATSLSAESATASPATRAALQHIDQLFRRAVGRSAFEVGGATSQSIRDFIWPTDDVIAFATMLIFFLVLFLALLALKLVLGMCLLSFARHRYKGMKQREKTSIHAEGRRVGGWGVVEVDEDKRRWIYADDPEGAKKLREREIATKEKEARLEREGESFDKVARYEMINKRIW